MKLGNKLAEKRKELGITQMEIAEKMHVTRQTVSRWESGAAFPDIEKVAELAGILKVSCDYLLKDDEAAVAEAADVPLISPLMMKLLGKHVKLNFFDEEGDIDLYDTVCLVKGFEGNWMDIEAVSSKKSMRKLVAISSVLSVEIVEEK